jgi:hypothetical protein
MLKVAVLQLDCLSITGVQVQRSGHELFADGDHSQWRTSPFPTINMADIVNCAMGAKLATLNLGS